MGVSMLNEGEWRLVYPGVDLTFGNKVYPIVEPPDLGAAEPETQDAAYPAADGTQFGRDFRPGRTIAFELGINEHANVDGLASHNNLARAWRGDSIRQKPGAVAELHALHGGRERVVYGRPRRYASVLVNNQSGYSGATCDFACSDDLFYDASVTSTTVGLYASPSGGIEAPIIAPITTTAPSTVPGQVDVGGLVDTWPVITIQGPIEWPRVELVGLWRFELNTTLEFDESVTIDTRPWARTVLRNDGANLAGRLTRRSVQLSKATLPAGASSQLQFTGYDLSGTSSVTVSHRAAYPHL